MTGHSSVYRNDGEDGEVDRRTENEENIIEWMGMTGTDSESTANCLERNSQSELYYTISPSVLVQRLIEQPLSLHVVEQGH